MSQDNIPSYFWSYMAYTAIGTACLLVVLGGVILKLYLKEKVIFVEQFRAFDEQNRERLCVLVE